MSDEQRTVLDDICLLNDGELLAYLHRAELSNTILHSISSWGRQEGWTEVRTLRTQVAALAAVYEDMLKLSVSELENRVPPLIDHREDHLCYCGHIKKNHILGGRCGRCSCDRYRSLMVPKVAKEREGTTT